MDDRLSTSNRTLLLLHEVVDASDTEIAGALHRTRVYIAVDASAARADPTQGAVATLTNLLVRTGISVAAALPTAPVRTPLLGGAPNLRHAMEALVPTWFPGAAVEPSAERPTIGVVIGTADAPTCERTVWLGGDHARWTVRWVFASPRRRR